MIRDFVALNVTWRFTTIWLPTTSVEGEEGKVLIW